MKKLLPIFLCLGGFAAHAGYDDGRFRAEVLEGLDVRVARENVDVAEEEPHGEMGLEVYQTANDEGRRSYAIYIPTSMYVRGGLGANMAFASSGAKAGDNTIDLSNSWSTQLGLGWNMSSYVRSEIDFQTENLRFSDYPDATANMRGVGGNVYFDFAKRYVKTGDIIRRRTFVPFMGLGVGVGSYEFNGGGGKGLYVAPRASLGFNIMFNDLFGIDVTYQYQLAVGNSMGWDTNTGTMGISDVIASFRFNF